MRSILVFSRFNLLKGNDLGRFLRKHLNFYRVHILAFVFIPLIFSAIFYASNGKFQISYVDSLFLCVSAMTVCGLATVDLSQLTAWQQTILFILMCLGSPVVVSWIMVLIRKFYFAKKFEHLIESNARRTTGLVDVESTPSFARQISSLFRRQPIPPSVPVDDDVNEKAQAHGRGSPPPKKVRTDMIRRMDDAPKLINPSGWISEGRTALPVPKADTIQSNQDPNRHLSFAEPLPMTERDRPTFRSPLSAPTPEEPHQRSQPSRRLSDPGRPSRPPSLISAPMHRFETMAEDHSPTFLPRTQTVEFAPINVPRRRTRMGSEATEFERKSSHRGVSLAPHATMSTYMTRETARTRRSKNSGFGGFPMPHEIIKALFEKFFPQLKTRLTRTITVPRTTTIASTRGEVIPPGAKPVPYISFEAVVGRNSAFPMLTEEQLEELGGVEYRALNALLWIVAGYHIILQLIAYIIVAPYMSMDRWREDLTAPPLQRPLPPPWYSLFQVVSSYTNTGLSLVDTSMLPFQRAYPVILLMVFLILAGNTCFPIFLRFTIWIITKLVPKHSRANETLHFLLDHPRRCFIYLFPSHQTWFLFTIVVALTFTDWFFFMILDIGTPAIEQIPLGLRILVGWLQAVAVRAAGFGIVSISSLAPAVKVLYVVMMYISVYPIAMSVRSTNVYEEQSLGVFHDPEDSDEEDKFDPYGPRVTVWSRYLAMHARKQLSFDMWWLGLALFLVCIIERHEIENEASTGWFNIFNIIFELTSAYGGVGLSLGIPTENYSFSGAFTTLSKLIVIIVMIRGRHRGLPVAIDRAVMLPSEFQRGDSVGIAESGAPLSRTVFNDEASDSGESSEIRQRNVRTSNSEGMNGPLERTRTLEIR